MSPVTYLSYPKYTYGEDFFLLNQAFFFSVLVIKQIQVGNDQEKAQSERNSYSKKIGGKNKMTIRYLYCKVTGVKVTSALHGPSPL